MISLPKRLLHGRYHLPTLPLALTLISMSMATTACGRPAAGPGATEITLQLLGEKSVGPATVEVTLRTSQGDPIEGAQVSVRGDMSHAGMAPVLASCVHSSSGRYVTEGFRFTMAGDWILTALVILPDGQKAERSFNVNGVVGR